ncbi:MAG: multiheme c-type cytochrome, partial [Nitrospirota bacterium]
GHARAFAALVRTGDQYDPECVPCHVTGYGYMAGYGQRSDLSGRRLKDVTCEGCHGSGASHVKSETTGEKAAASGIARSVSEQVCLSCHDEYNSPNFQYERYMDIGGAHRGEGGKTK